MQSVYWFVFTLFIYANRRCVDVFVSATLGNARYRPNMMFTQRGKRDKMGLEKEITNIRELHFSVSGAQQGAISHAFESPLLPYNLLCSSTESHYTAVKL